MGWVYSRLPLTVRYGSELAEGIEFLNESQWWSREQHRTFQWQQVKQLLTHAYENVPYYRRVWRRAGFTPGDINSLDELHQLPLLTKDEVRTNKDELVAQNYRSKLLAANTGGSTGQPLEFYWERGRTRALERAFMWRQWGWAGFENGERTAVLRGQTVAEGIHFDPIDNHLFLSGFDVREETAAEYLRVLREFKPVSLQGYPSTVTLLANYMRRHNQPPIEGLKVVLCGSENLYPSQRAVIEKAFGSRVYSWYGQGESVCLAGACDVSDHYHVYSEYGYSEIVDETGQPLEWTPGTKGEIVGTGFNNWAMPLIRYQTLDIAVVGPNGCSCGRNYPLWERIEGRTQEYIVGPDGRLVALTAFIFGQHYDAFESIKRLQIVQHRPGEIAVKLTVVAGWSDADESRLHVQMLQALGDSRWQIEYKYIDDIELTARGKHRFVIQHLPLEHTWSGNQEE